MSFKKKVFDLVYGEFLERNSRTFASIAWGQADNFSCNPAIASYANNVGDYDVLTLNIGPNACKLVSHDEGLFFEGRFNGKIESEFFPWSLVKSVFNPENREEGFALPSRFPEVDSTEAKPAKEEKKRPTFGVIDGGKGGSVH